MVRYHGDIAAVYTWVNDERALVLVPHRRPGAPWYVVMDSAAYTWDDEDPQYAPQVAQKSAQACHVLGLEPTPRNAYRVAKIIVEGLPDLQRMPNAQPPAPVGPVLGEMQIRAEGKLVGGEEVRAGSTADDGLTFDGPVTVGADG